MDTLFKKASWNLGIVEYPDELDQFAKEKYTGRLDPANIENIRNLQESENIFGEYCDLVIEAAKQLQGESSAYLWAKVVSEYIYVSSCGEARKVKIPEADGSLLRDMLPLLVMIPSMLEMRKIMEDRRFDDDRILENMKIFQNCLAATKRKTGRLAHDRHYFKWTMLFLKGLIFSMNGFKFEVKKLPESAVYLQNIVSKKIVPVMKIGAFHSSGAVLGSAGYEDAYGSFLAEFEERQDAFVGHPVENGAVLRETQAFFKDEWKVLAAPGDYALGMHIPKGTDISKDAFDRAVEQAQGFMSEHYKEYAPVCLICHSWLLDPTLSDILGKESRIVRFGERFTRIPVKSAGKEVFSFVFPPQIKSLDELPENTRLEKGLKSLYLGGGFIHGYEGIAPLKDEKF